MYVCILVVVWARSEGCFVVPNYIYIRPQDSGGVYVVEKPQNKTKNQGNSDSYSFL